MSADLRKLVWRKKTHDKILKQVYLIVFMYKQDGFVEQSSKVLNIVDHQFKHMNTFDL